ncbi:hypothetical protein BS50DRAFT_627978 [Corynespora cassiicola Philippines]|uniref:Uncharacterized protein n=1 Tax=Corynespora cassiicola Philippines TaxID=1448308 RepID=A0A2T2PAL1_CORCC|nr:hypothetical protein BS50DRAFT_627978 [Corynespora cassiicola Philippines]
MTPRCAAVGMSTWYMNKANITQSSNNPQPIINNMSSIRSSFETTKSAMVTSTISDTSSLLSSTKSPSTAKKAWNAVKKHAIEHHKSVNAAYATYYGQGQGRNTV